MKRLLNTLFITSEDIYLSLDGENVVANKDKERIARYPLHNFQSIITFSYSGASPALMNACAERGISMAFCSQHGKYLASVKGKSNGNVILRREQYRIADDEKRACAIARNMIFGKIYNSKWCIERTIRDHSERVDVATLKNTTAYLQSLYEPALQSEALDHLRGIEGKAASSYFDVFDQLILNKKEIFTFNTRNRRPPTDDVNAMLSFAYTLLAHDCASALESVGLDSCVGFMHRDRPGRESLALDLMEELRPCIADRFVLTLINNRKLNEKDFVTEESGAVRMTAEGRKIFLNAWQERKTETVTHPYLEEKLQRGMIPYAQAILLARYIRGDTDEYPPFLWK